MLEKFDVAVRGMEEFGARTEAPLQTCLAEVEQADVYVGIIGFRLGSINETTGKSFTQVEYERALELRKKILIYLINEEEAQFQLKQIDIDDPSLWQRLLSFKRTLRERHTVETFTTSKDLVTKLERDFHKYLSLKVGQTTPSEMGEYEISKQTIGKFMLTPKLLSGSEVRLRVQLSRNRFAAARGLCDAFNLQYGATVGVSITVLEPKIELSKTLTELYSPGTRVQELLDLPIDKPVDIYARLEFSSADVPRTRARFFSDRYVAYPIDEMNPSQTIHEPAEGKIIFLFSKLPKVDVSGNA
ncbi:MAG: DUF4062 domain-containing protein [Methanotrichaceae archaeon]|nr:DUF4062 domain-containing protein [Methanotrichaceae archaeon]